MIMTFLLCMLVENDAKLFTTRIHLIHLTKQRNNTNETKDGEYIMNCQQNVNVIRMYAYIHRHTYHKQTKFNSKRFV